jgi:hypothetical protein
MESTQAQPLATAGAPGSPLCFDRDCSSTLRTLLRGPLFPGTMAGSKAAEAWAGQCIREVARARTATSPQLLSPEVGITGG